MSFGNDIVVSTEPRGVFMEGIVGAGLSPVPGQLMEVDPTVAIVQGRHTYKYSTPGADGGRPQGALYIVRNVDLLGKSFGIAYAAGDRLFLYCPAAGEEVNVLLADIAGTADSHNAGEVLIIKNATGKLIATTGTPVCQPFKLLENIVQPAADSLAWCLYSGY